MFILGFNQVNIITMTNAFCRRKQVSHNINKCINNTIRYTLEVTRALNNSCLFTFCRTITSFVSIVNDYIS